jgi:hypothetical protein
VTVFNYTTYAVLFGVKEVYIKSVTLKTHVYIIISPLITNEIVINFKNRTSIYG